MEMDLRLRLDCHWDALTYVPLEVLVHAASKIIGMPVTYEGKVIGKIVGFDIIGEGVELKAKVTGVIGGRVREKIQMEDRRTKITGLDLHEVSILNFRQVMDIALKITGSGITQERSAKPARTSESVNQTSDQAP